MEQFLVESRRHGKLIIAAVVLFCLFVPRMYMLLTQSTLYLLLL